MSSTRRIACVRIPRFPIGVVWRHAIDSGNAQPQTPSALGEQQLLLPIVEELPSRVNGDAPSPRLPATRSFLPTLHGQNTTSGRSQRPKFDAWGRAPSEQPLEGRNENRPRHWDEIAIVLAEGQRVRTATAAAGRARIRAGMTVAEAKSRCGELAVLEWNAAIIDRAVARATAAFVRASPQVAAAAGAPGLWWIGASGYESLGGDRRVAKELAAIARMWHPSARVGVADSCVAARAATWHAARGGTSAAASAAGYTIVPPGGCAAYLAPAPLGLLTIDRDLHDSLTALGLRTIGDLARLEAEDVERRWGPTGLWAWELSRGIDERRATSVRVDAPRHVSTDLAASVETAEPIVFLVRAALDRLVRDLIADGRAAATIAITLTLDDAQGVLPSSGRAHTVTREVRLPRPLARAVPLLERCRALLEEWPLTAPVSGVTVAIVATAPLSGAQGELLDAAWRDPAAADAAFARLRATLGTDAIVRPVVRDTHRPERAAGWERVESADDDTTHAPAPAPATTDIAFRQLDPPEPADVDVPDESPDAVLPPRAVHWRNRWVRVQRAVGPERLAGDWWDDAYARDYWRLEDADHGPDLVVYHDLKTLGSGQGWYVQGWYD